MRAGLSFPAARERARSSFARASSSATLARSSSTRFCACAHSIVDAQHHSPKVGQAVVSHRCPSVAHHDHGTHAPPFPVVLVAVLPLYRDSHFWSAACGVWHTKLINAPTFDINNILDWEELNAACGSSGTVTLSDNFVMGTYTPTPSPQYGGIDFNGKQLVSIGNNKMLDAGEQG
jgi:hypothetical protein